jgi:hypothetical protein
VRLAREDRAPRGGGGTLEAMEDEPAEIVLELEEARAAHAKATALLESRMRDLDELWRQAKPTDRLLAVQRLVQTKALEDEQVAAVEAKNERVRDVMGRARSERRRLEKLLESGGDDHELRHKVFLLELDLQRAEQERDELIDSSDLRGALYFCGETFVRTAPFAAGEEALNDLAARLRNLEERARELERAAPRRGAKYISKGPDGRERTLIRMLPALTMEGESEPL